MEKLTIVRLGETNEKSGTRKDNGKPYKFYSTGFQAKEKGETWFNFAHNEQVCGLEEGKQYEFELTPRDYNGKQYWNAKFPKKTDKVDEKLEQILNAIVGIKIELASINGKLAPKKSHYPTREDEGMTEEEPQDIPFS